MRGNRDHFKPTTYNSPHNTAKTKAKAKEKEKETERARAKAKAKNGTRMPIKHQIMTTGRVNHSFTIRISERIMELIGAKQKAALKQLSKRLIKGDSPSA